jgi:hypothetical protein
MSYILSMIFNLSGLILIDESATGKVKDKLISHVFPAMDIEL